MKRKVDYNTITVEDFNTPLSKMDRSCRQKVTRKHDMNHALDQMNLRDVFRTFNPIAEHTFFSSAQITFSRIELKIGHKTHLSKFKKTEIILSIYSDHKGMKLEINNMEKVENPQLCGN